MFVLVHIPLYTVTENDTASLGARSLTLLEAFARVMALSGREGWVFTRTARVMHLVILPSWPGAPEFESTIASDGPAHRDIMAQALASIVICCSQKVAACRHFFTVQQPLRWKTS